MNDQLTPDLVTLNTLNAHTQEHGITLVCIEVQQTCIQARVLAPEAIHPVWFNFATLDEATIREAIIAAHSGVEFVELKQFQLAYEARIPTLDEFYASLHTDTDAHPFCPRYDCPCHENIVAFQECIQVPLDEGLLTSYEAIRIFYGCHL